MQVSSRRDATRTKLAEREAEAAPTATGRATAQRRPYPVIDADVHHCFRGWADFAPYMDEPWRSIVTDPGSRPGGNGYRAYGGHHRRDDARPADGSPPGSDIPLLRRQLLEEAGVDIAVLTGDHYGANIYPNQDYANAIVQASNDWVIDKWLPGNPEFRAAITINSLDADHAVKEIERLGPRPEFCMAIAAGASTSPYGNRRFHKIYEAAEHFGLPIGVHPASAGVGMSYSVTGVGHPTTYFEYHTGLSLNFQAHLISLICEGVFEKFPRLKWIFIEGGISWVVHAMWRLDKNWKALRGETPWVRRKPSDYIKEHCRFTTQPIEEPEHPEQLLQIFEIIDARRTVMYSSDYPHWDFDGPSVFAGLPADLQKRILSDTPRETLRLGLSRS